MLKMLNAYANDCHETLHSDYSSDASPCILIKITIF